MTRDALLEKVRKICLGLPGATEGESFGHPWFRAAGKPFAIYGTGGDAGVDTLSLKLPEALCAAVAGDPRWSVTHYIGKHGWRTRALGGKVAWAEIAMLVETSYRMAAPRKLLAALDGQVAPEAKPPRAKPPRAKAKAKRPAARAPRKRA